MQAFESDLELLRHYRRDLHQIPEVGFELPETLSYVHRVLESLLATSFGKTGKLRIWSPAKSCLCAFFDVGAQHTLAVRADMDGLPVSEDSGVSFASKHAGKMHACGHDGHMAMALGLARWLALHPEEASVNVLVIFEPAEETTGGARTVIESGALKECTAEGIIGFHLWPDLAEGQIASRPSALLAGSNEVNIDVKGRSSHIAKASQGADALEAAARILLSCYASVKEFNNQEACLLKFGYMQAGRVRNQIASSARLEGSLRSFSQTMQERLKSTLGRVAKEEAEKLGCSTQLSFSEGYPPVMNDPSLYANIKGLLPELTDLEEPLLISDDFAWYQREIPGVFLLLGTGTGIPLHSDKFYFDESILVRGLLVYQRIIRQIH